MEKWKYKSLEWIHKIREEDYKKTKDLSPKELIEKTSHAAAAIVSDMGLKVVPSKTTSTR